MEMMFWIVAVMGTTLFVLKTVLLLVAGVGEHTDHIEVDGDHDGHGTDVAFRIFSTHSIVGFFMMFGWVGLACMKQYELSHGMSITAACLAGCIMMVISGLLFKFAGLFVSQGDQFAIDDLVGQTATVYLRITSQGGLIRLNINGRQREIRAVSFNQQLIPSFSHVKVLEIVNHNTVSVRPQEIGG